LPLLAGSISSAVVPVRDKSSSLLWWTDWYSFPAVFVPLVLTGVFPHLLMTFAILDPLLAIGAWVLSGRLDDLQ
jgi:hypothetical protein